MEHWNVTHTPPGKERWRNGTPISLGLSWPPAFGSGNRHLRTHYSVRIRKDPCRWNVNSTWAHVTVAFFLGGGPNIFPSPFSRSVLGRNPPIQYCKSSFEGHSITPCFKPNLILTHSQSQKIKNSQQNWHGKFISELMCFFCFLISWNLPITPRLCHFVELFKPTSAAGILPVPPSECQQSQRRGATTPAGSVVFGVVVEPPQWKQNMNQSLDHFLPSFLVGWK